MANSSPPSRVIVSTSRTTLRRRSATSHNRRSPTGWPSVSFTVLNRSRSRYSTARLCPRRTRRRKPATSSRNATRFGRPVSASCRARWLSSHSVAPQLLGGFAQIDRQHLQMPGAAQRRPEIGDQRSGRESVRRPAPRSRSSSRSRQPMAAGGDEDRAPSLVDQFQRALPVRRRQQRRLVGNRPSGGRVPVDEPMAGRAVGIEAHTGPGSPRFSFVARIFWIIVSVSNAPSTNPAIGAGVPSAACGQRSDRDETHHSAIGPLHVHQPQRRGGGRQIAGPRTFEQRRCACFRTRDRSREWGD